MIAEKIAAQAPDPRPVPPTAAKTASKRSFADLLAIAPTPTRASSKNDKLDESASSAQTFRRKPKDSTDDSNAGAAAVAGASTQVQPTQQGTPASASDAAANAQLSGEADAATEAAAKIAALAAGKEEAQQAAAAAGDAPAAPLRKNQAGVAPPPGAADLGVKVAAGAKKLVSQPGAALASVSPLDARFGKSDAAQDISGVTVPIAAQNAQKAVDPNSLQQAAPAHQATSSQQQSPTQTTPDAKDLSSPAALANEAAAAHAAAQGAKAQNDDRGPTATTEISKSEDTASPTPFPLANSGVNSPQVQETAKPETAQRPSTPPPPVLEQVAFNLKHAVSGGLDQIEIQLRPASLGAIQVKLDLTHDGKVTATVTAERNDTLQLLQRDASGLQQALRDAGLQADSNSLNFSLRGDPGAGQQQFAHAQGNGGRNSGGSSGNSGRFLSGHDDAAGNVAASAATTRSHSGRLDIQV